jgi:hypothetical protein
MFGIRYQIHITTGKLTMALSAASLMKPVAKINSSNFLLKERTGAT